jgi:YHS domain-containing protein
MAKDPVCGMEVSPEAAAASTELDGVTYYFCAEGCKEAFLEDPQRYIPSTASREHGWLRRLLRRG